MIDQSRILVLGGSGMVGSQIVFGIKPAHQNLDITDEHAIAHYVEEHKPSAIINTAGLVDVKRCEENPAVAQKANVDGAHNIAAAAHTAGIPVIYFSSCMVFDGEKKEPYTEDDAPNPLTVYGKTKLAGEQATLEASSQSLIVRTGWLFGGFERDIKFIHRFYDSLMAGKPIRATSDRYGSPTYVPDLIRKSLKLLENGTTGIAHVVNAGVVSYYDVAMKLKELTASAAEVTPVTQLELSPHEAPRGSMEGLVSNRGIKLRSYDAALAEYVSALSK